jgi:hypothetical protein
MLKLFSWCRDDMDKDDEMEDADAGDKGKAPEAPMSEELPEILLEGNALYRLQVCTYTAHRRGMGRGGAGRSHCGARLFFLVVWPKRRAAPQSVLMRCLPGP